MSLGDKILHHCVPESEAKLAQLLVQESSFAFESLALMQLCLAED
jgi:hypothetical protein